MLDKQKFLKLFCLLKGGSGSEKVNPSFSHCIYLLKVDVARFVSLWLDQYPHRGATFSGCSAVRPIRAPSGLSRFVLDIGGWGLSPNGAI